MAQYLHIQYPSGDTKSHQAIKKYAILIEWHQKHHELKYHLHTSFLYASIAWATMLELALIVAACSVALTIGGSPAMTLIDQQTDFVERYGSSSVNANNCPEI